MFEFSVTLAVVLFLSGLCATTLLVPPVMKLARRVGAVDRGGYRKVYAGDAMPLLGGLSIAVPVIFTCAAASVVGLWSIRHWEWICVNHRDLLSPALSLAVFRKEFMALALGGTAIVVLGVYDDMRNMRPRYKLAGQVLVAFLFCCLGYVLKGVNIPSFGMVQFSIVVGYLVTILWIVGLINALNLIDGIDGLAAGTSCIISLAMGIVGLLGGSVLVAVVSALMVGSTLAFLRYNFHPARIFLGDTGSMFLGFILAGATLMGATKSGAAAMVLAPLLALGFPISETLISMGRRFLQGKPIFSGDQRHTHHRLLKLGYSQRQAVLLLYGVTLLLSIAAVLNQVLASSQIPIMLYVVTIIGIVWLAGYLRPESFRRLSVRRQRVALFRALSRYAVLRLNSQEDSSSDLPEVLDLVRKQLGLGFLAVWMAEDERLIASSGEMREKRPTQYDAVESLRVRCASGFNVAVKFQFVERSNESAIIDTSACLAGLFEGARITPPPASVVEVPIAKNVG